MNGGSFYDAMLERWIAAGYAVERTDYEGLGTAGVFPFLIGKSEGRSVLDIIRAAHELNPALSERAVTVGHSLGGHAALWAASMAPRYTPEVRLLGVAALAPSSHLAVETALSKRISSTAFTALAAEILRGATVAYPSLRPQSLLTPAALALWPQTLRGCEDQLSAADSFGGLPLDQAINPNADLNPLIAALVANDPGKLRIRAPVLIEQGAADQLVFASFTTELVASLSKLGDRVAYHQYPGVTHDGVVAAADRNVLSFLHHRFARRAR